MGIVAVVLVATCAKGLTGETAKVLLDREMDRPVVEEIREVVEDRSAWGRGSHRDSHSTIKIHLCPDAHEAAA